MFWVNSAEGVSTNNRTWTLEIIFKEMILRSIPLSTARANRKQTLWWWVVLIRTVSWSLSTSTPKWQPKERASTFPICSSRSRKTSKSRRASARKKATRWSSLMRRSNRKSGCRSSKIWSGSTSSKTKRPKWSRTPRSTWIDSCRASSKTSSSRSSSTSPFNSSRSSKTAMVIQNQSFGNSWASSASSRAIVKAPQSSRSFRFSSRRMRNSSPMTRWISKK